MSEILPGLHLIDGVDPSPEFTTHVYLLKDKGPTWTLIDAGLPGSHAAIETYLAQHRIDPTSIKKILLTHLHRDHTGGLKALANHTHAKTYAHWVEAAYIERDPPYDGPGAPPGDAQRIDETLKDGDTIDAAGGLIAYHTPGHTPGHTVYYQPERKWLFCGDLFVVAGDRVVLSPPQYTLHAATALISARRVSQLSVESLLSYHGGPLLENAGKAMRAFALAP